MSQNHNENVPLKENGIGGEEAMATVIVKPKQKWTKFQKLHVCITLVLLAVCITLVGIYIIEFGSAKGGSKECGTKTSSKRVCESPECIAIAAQVLTYADQTIDPCVNFYDFACSGWKKQSYIPDSKGTWDTFSDLMDANDKLLKKQLVDGKPNKNSSAEVELYELYSSCLNTTAIDTLGLKPFKDLIASMSLEEAVGSNINVSSWDMTNSLAKVHSIFAPVFMSTGAPLFDTSVVVDIKKSSDLIVKISQPGLPCGGGRESDELSSKSYLDLMVKIHKMIGAKNPEQDAKDVSALEQAISKGFISKDRCRDVQSSRRTIKLKDLITATNVSNNKVDWLRYLKLVLKPTGINITEDTKIAIQPLSYLKKMAETVSNTPESTIAKYFIWRVIKELKDYMPSTITKTFFNYEKAKSGVQVEAPKWQTCLREMEVNMGMALSAIFVREKFKDEDKKEVETMIDNIKNSFLSIVQKSDWMDQETKANAAKKAKALIGNIAYPSFIKDPKKLADYYTGVSLNKSEYFKNMVQLKRIKKQKNIVKLTKKVDREEWGFPPSFVNAFYDSGRNKMVFMAGILQSPFFSRDAPKAVNYGGIGMVMGHELSHGFDDQGRLFDEKGNMKSWWTSKSTKAYKEREKCIMDQYSNYSMFNIKLNGKLTLGENIADNSGIETSFKAYKTWVQENGPPKSLPGVNMTDDQLFFLASAQIWCASDRPEHAKNSILRATHSPGIFRVRGTLSNSKEFAKAFNCPSGSPMNPKKKCSIW